MFPGDLYDKWPLGTSSALYNMPDLWFVTDPSEQVGE